MGSPSRQLEEDRESIQVQRRLTEAATAWESHNRDRSYLYHGLRLAEAETWQNANPTMLNVTEQAFLSASLAARRRAQHQRIGLIGASAALLAAVFIFYILLQNQTNRLMQIGPLHLIQRMI